MNGPDTFGTCELEYVIPKYSNFKFSDFDQKITFLVLFQGPLYEQEVYGGMNSRLFMNIHDSHVSQAELTWPLRRVLCRVQAKQNSRPKISNINPSFKIGVFDEK